MELRPNSQAAYEIELCVHLLPFFQHHRLRDITVAEVDRYRGYKLKVWNAWQERPSDQRPHRQRPAGPAQINRTIKLLAQVLEDAVEYELLDRNPARGKRRKLKVVKRPRPHLDRAAHAETVLEAAAMLDARARADRRHIARHAIVGVLLLGGLRLDELVNVCWRHTDLVGRRIQIGEAKTAAGVRYVHLVGGLLPLLEQWSVRAPHREPGRFLFASATGRRASKENIRNRVVAPTFALADELLAQRNEVPLPEGLTPHGLRHTFATMLVATGEDPRYVMAQLGHTDPAFTLGFYTHEIRREKGEKDRIRALLHNPQPPSAKGQFRPREPSVARTRSPRENS